MSEFTTTSVAPGPPAAVFAEIIDTAKWPSFTGWGPLPGIVRATVEGGPAMALGARVRVENTDGSVHHEVVVAFEPGRHLQIRMDLVDGAARLLMAGIDEHVTLDAVDGGTRVTRRFVVRPRSWATAPVTWLIAAGLRRAVERHNARFARSPDLEGRSL